MARKETPTERLERQLRELNSGKYRGLDDPKPKNRKRTIKAPTLAMVARKRIERDGHWVPLETRLENLQGRVRLQEQRKCAKPEGCKQPAVRGSDFCRHHGGGKIALERRLSDPEWRPDGTSKVHRAVRTAVENGALPREMLENPIVRDVIDKAAISTRLPDEMRGARDPAGADRFLKRRTMARRMLNELAAAYLILKDHGDLNPWVAAVARARSAGFGQ